MEGHGGGPEELEALNLMVLNTCPALKVPWSAPQESWGK